MKAKDYARKYLDDPTDQVLVDICSQFLDEAKQIAESRHCKYDSAFIAVMREQDRKWRAFAILAGAHIKPDGFRNIVARLMPTIYVEWVAHEVRLGINKQ